MRRIETTSHMGSEVAVEGALAGGMVGGAIETWDRLDSLLSSDVAKA